VGALQQFTSDKRQLNAAIERVKWYMSGRGGISAFAPIEGGPQTAALAGVGGADESRARGTTPGDAGEALEDFREEIFSVGTLGALNFVVRGMRELPGRKSVILLSEGFSLFTVDRGRGTSDRVLQAVRRLTDLANRASVVVYSIDTRGLVYTGLTAADDVGGLSNERIDEMVRARGDKLFDTQSGLHYLSQQTGGFLVRNNNDIAKALAKVGEDQKGYYLIGYRPESTTYDRRYHTYAVKVKRPGLKVRTRAGFYGIRDEETRPVRRTREQQLMAALTSPFASSAVRLRLTTIFGDNAQEGSFMRSLMHINANDLKFDKEPDGKYQAALDVVGLTFGDNGRVVDSREQSGKLSMDEETYRKVLREGLIYSVNVPIKKAGAYQLRMAVRDASTEQTGSASQFIEVPDLKKNRLALSGVVLSGIRAAEMKKTGDANATTSAQAGVDKQPAEGALNEQETLASPAVRRFRQNSSFDFGYVIYNARLDKTTNLPQLTTQTRIFRDGQPVFNGKEQPVDVTQNPDLKRISFLSRLRLGSALTPGEYVLQVVVTDMLAKEKDRHRVATQWIDFEIVK
jgi:VWFA-related protein